MIAQLLQQDERGMEALLLHYGPLMRYIIAPILPDPQDREECLSEVSMRVWSRIAQFDPARGSWNAWLTAVTRSTALNYQRSAARHGGTQTLPEGAPSPEEIVADVTPWRRAMNRILFGMALCAITLNFWCLNYILPAIGTVLLLLGFRTLRRENRWLGGCFAVTVIRAACFFATLILNTTILQSAVFTPAVTTTLTVINAVLLLALYFCFWRGLLAVQKKAGLPAQAGGALALIVWYALVCVLAAVHYTGWIVPIAMLVGYGCILRSLYRLSGALDEAGYAIAPGPVRVTDRCLVLVIAAVLGIGCTLGYLFGSSYRMDWQPADTSKQTQTEAIRQQLLDLGFPEAVLNDLTPEDIAACDGALRVVVETEDYPVNDGRNVLWEAYNEKHERYYVQDTVYDVKELRLTGVAVQLPGERETWMVFHHFLWTADPGFYGTEAIQIRPAYRSIPEGWSAAGDVTGRVLYDRDGQTFAAPYASLGAQTFTANTVLWGEQTNTDLFAAFSLPRHAEHARGYVAYSTTEALNGYIFSSGEYYVHQQTWLQYPAVTAMEKRLTAAWGDTGAFRTVQDALQFYPADGQLLR